MHLIANQYYPLGIYLTTRFKLIVLRFFFTYTHIMLLAAAFIFSFGPYHAEAIRVVDGDTIVGDVALWPGLTQQTSIRVFGINTPELHKTECEKADALKAKEFTAEFVLNKDMVLTEVKNDKFGGRVNAHVFVAGKSLATALLEAHLAVPYQGGFVPPWCIDTK